MRTICIASLACVAFVFSACYSSSGKRVIFDAHLHGNPQLEAQLNTLEKAGVEFAAISTSWDLQNSYRGKPGIRLLYGLMLPCPAGRVPYSGQNCFEDGKEWPPVDWVEAQVKAGKIDFIGEVLAQYYGIASGDSTMFTYYEIAERHNLPVGVHTGSAGPDHGSPNFREELGNPLLLKPALEKFPKLRVWLMHAGGPFFNECLAMMKEYPNIYTDISAMNNPAILPPTQFESMMKALVEAGFENRIMFGSDNADINITTAALDKLDFLTGKQKKKILHDNAREFFRQ